MCTATELTNRGAIQTKHSPQKLIKMTNIFQSFSASLLAKMVRRAHGNLISFHLKF